MNCWDPKIVLMQVKNNDNYDVQEDNNGSYNFEEIDLEYTSYTWKNDRYNYA